MLRAHSLASATCSTIVESSSKLIFICGVIHHVTNHCYQVPMIEQGFDLEVCENCFVQGLSCETVACRLLVAVAMAVLNELNEVALKAYCTEYRSQWLGFCSAS